MNIEEKQHSLLTFRVGPVLCCAPSSPVLSIITPPKLTQTPGSDSSRPGIFKHGSHIVQVLDLRQKFGIEKSEQTQPGNLIISILDKEGFAFWVDQILDVFDFPAEGWGNLPPAIPRGIFTRTLLINKKIHLYSEFDKLSTIPDLGYLENYISQLQQHDEKQKKEVNTLNRKIPTAIKTIDEKVITAPAEKTKKEPNILLASTNKMFSDNKPEPTYQPSLTSKIKNKKTNVLTSKTSTPPPPVSNTKVSSSNGKIKLNNSTAPYKSTPVINTKDEPSSPLISATKEPLQSPHKTNLTKNNSYSLNNEDDDIIHENKKESSSMGIVIFFLIILILFAVGFYYLFTNDSTKNSKHKKQKPIQYTEIVQQPTQQDYNESIREPITREPVQIADIPSDNPSEPKDQDIITAVTSSIDKQEKQIIENKYKADILQQDNEITITLHQSMPNVINHIEDKKEKSVAPMDIVESEVKANSETESGAVIETSPVVIINEKQLNKTTTPNLVNSEVIHTVVKGDTLWAIAKKYVDNPFLYPELARLSNIKNPHRIYPGNRVRIRFIKN